MIVDEKLERLYRQVELIKGAGDPRAGKLCVMSFVAYLAGEGHSDRPGTASPLIRELAVRLNDAMPATMRQDLKPFVPRILGTNDGHDAQRSALLREVAEREILPRVWSDSPAKSLVRDWNRATEFMLLSRRLLDLARDRGIDADTPSRCRLAAAVVSLLCFCATEAPDASSCRWYWWKAIDLLDRSCDIGSEGTTACINEQRIESLQKILARRERRGGSKAMTDRAVGRIRAILGWSANAI